MYEHNALGYWSGLALCLTKVRSSRARCPATALIFTIFLRSGSKEFAQSMVLNKNKKHRYSYPSLPQFCYIKVGFKGVFM